MTDLALPPGAGDQCNHEGVSTRVKIPANQYVCEDCGKTLYLVIPQYGLMDKENHEKYKQALVQAKATAERKKIGLVLPSEVQQEGRKR